MKSFSFKNGMIVIGTSAFLFFSCSKKNDTVRTVSKQQMLGKWTMVIQSANGPQTWHTELKASGAMEIDAAPYDGVIDLIVLWDLKGNNFTAHLDANGISNYFEFQAPVDPATLAMAGQLKVNAVNSPETDIFTMNKQ